MNNSTILQSLFIAYFMGGVKQARLSAKRLKGQTRDVRLQSLLVSLQSQQSDTIAFYIHNMYLELK